MCSLWTILTLLTQCYSNDHYLERKRLLSFTRKQGPHYDTDTPITPIKQQIPQELHLLQNNNKKKQPSSTSQIPPLSLPSPF